MPPAAPAKRAKRKPPPGRVRPALELLAVVVLGAILGTGLAVLAARLLPAGPLLTPLTRTVSLGLDPPRRLDVGVATLTLGFTIRVGLLTFLGAAGAAVSWQRSRR